MANKRRPILTKIEFAGQLATYANISLKQANACIEYYSLAIAECMKAGTDFQLYEIGKFQPKICEQVKEIKNWRQFNGKACDLHGHGDYIKMTFKVGDAFAKELRESTEQPFDPLRNEKEDSDEG